VLQGPDLFFDDYSLQQPVINGLQIAANGMVYKLTLCKLIMILSQA
jgi:hypothetical protein